ncbi:receptor-like protein kinase HSL1 [Panicum miliaceum]|uniref:Receptor-like protein kinase HSL1 n=1 Tax=Panicum miliaceum TaxID=4540 RepID=A0A3L6RRU4_PANMI|nr:receptor-like protein kinase HSL1 [Panicum miliaceum]
MAHSYLLFLLVFLTSTSSSQSMAQATDQETLLTIKKDWGSPSALSSWNPQNAYSHCSWAGVSCDNNGKVTKLSFPKLNITNPIPASICTLKNMSHLDLSYNNLTNQFPTELYGCSALSFLDLSNNHFSGALPADIDKLSAEMEHLNLSCNGFTGSVPSAIAALPKLKSLLLDTNSFNGTYPSSAIAELSELETLTLASNPFTPGPIPDKFAKLTTLKMLWMSDMNLTGGIPDKLSSLTELTTLALYDNKLHGEIPSWVWKLQKLEVLYLYANSFTGVIGPEVTAFSLQQLDLSANWLTGPMPEAIGDMKNLTMLYLYYNNLTGPIPASIGLLPNLVDIRLFNNRLSGPLPPELGKHSLLGNLEVSNNFLNGTVPDTLCLNKKLYDIVLFNNEFFGELPAALAACDTLDNIMLQNNHFAGEFPLEVWSAFPKLTTVKIQNNSFTGTLPSVISSNITRIEMGNNRFSGAVPSSALGLKSFMAENNRFSGELPANMLGFANLTDLNLAGNQISGSIPPSIRSLGRLNYLKLSSNLISGGIPAEIGLLPVLTMLDLSNNKLTGKIPPELNNLGLHLSSLNLSSNKLTGEIPESLQSPAFDEAFLGNHDLCATVNLNLNIPACYRGHNQMSTGLIILLSVVAGVILMGVVWCFIIRRKTRGNDLTTWKVTPFRKVDFTESDILNKLREENVIGSGGSGKVYRVHLGGCGGAVVAVKKLWSRGKAEEKLDKEFDSEVRILGDIRHNNIVSLLCYISSEDTKLLVYEYMENGSLDRWLHPRDPVGAGATAPLDWPTRLGIAIDAARGLSYMHHESAQPIMHRDVKSSNILLDPGFRAKIADFGLARILVKSGEPESVSAVGGTFGYMAPECGRGVKVNQKVDVYSFGVVLLELATGRVANDDGAECCLVEWAWRRYKAGGPLHDVVDGGILDRAVHAKDAVAVFLLGVMCTGDDAPSRPSMKQVLQQLLQYDRTSSVAGACRDVGDDGIARAQLPKGRKGEQVAKRPLESGGEFWDGDEESVGFVAHPV